MRATLAVMHHDVETIIAQSRRALEYLHPNNLPLRTATNWTLGYAYQLQGDRAAASRAYTEVISISKSFGDFHLHYSGYDRSGPGTGIRKRAVTGGRDLPASPAFCQVIRRDRLPAKRILVWPVYTTNGTIWMPLSSTGNSASN